MPVCRTQAQLQALFPDNDQALISAGDGRDLIATTFGYAAARDPTPDDDNVDTAGTGQFFDLGSNWLNTATQIWWICWSGLNARAIWQPLSGSGSPTGPAGGRLTGTYPNPLLANTGVVPGTYGDNLNYYATFTVSGDGTLTAAHQYLLPSITLIEPIFARTANYTVPSSDKYLRQLPEVSGITLFFQSPAAIGWTNGIWNDVSVITQSGPVIIGSPGSPTGFVGGGWSWTNQAGGPNPIPSFTLMGGMGCRVTSDGTLLRVSGLTVCNAVGIDSSGGSIAADSAWHTIGFVSAGGLGTWGEIGAASMLTAGNFVAPMTGFYAIDLSGVAQLHGGLPVLNDRTYETCFIRVRSGTGGITVEGPAWYGLLDGGYFLIASGAFNAVIYLAAGETLYIEGLYVGPTFVGTPALSIAIDGKVTFLGT